MVAFLKGGIILTENLTQTFTEIFGPSATPIRHFHAPGRINIIGEHIDYNGGYVLPCATIMGTYALIRQNNTSTTRFASTNFVEKGITEIPLADVTYNPIHDWANYPMGVLHYMQQDGHNIAGFDVLFSGNIPNGAGLSSSASLEVAMATALNELFGLGYAMIDLVKLAQRAENLFCGVNCGIMDQFAVGMGRKDFAIYLHCDTLEYRYIPMSLGAYKIVIMNTNKRRQLSESKYNERRAECEQALALLRKKHNITQLTDLAPDDFTNAAHLITDETIHRRARHVIHENHRVQQAVTALETGDIAAVGALLTQSHNSLRDDYEVSCRELDVIVAAALGHPACIGARMMGAGFGGCAIAFVEESGVEGFMQTISNEYTKTIGYAPGMYAQESGDGAREL